MAAEKPVILIDPKQIHREDNFSDSVVVYINRNYQKDFIRYAYFSSHPKEININGVLVDGKEEYVGDKYTSTICDFIGIYKTIHHGMRDIACGFGEKMKLIWDGKVYR